MFESSLTGSPDHVPDTPAEVPIPPPMPKSRIAHFVETIPITPVRLQGQRWRNWAATRLSHLPPNELYTDAEVIENLERNDDDYQNDEKSEENPAVVLPMPENENIVIEDLPDLEVQPTPKMKNCHC